MSTKQETMTFAMSGIYYKQRQIYAYELNGNVCFSLGMTFAINGSIYLVKTNF